MKLTLKQFFNEYPIAIKYIAELWGKDRTALSQIVNESIKNGKPRKATEKELQELEEIIHQVGERMMKVRLK